MILKNTKHKQKGKTLIISGIITIIILTLFISQSVAQSSPTDFDLILFTKEGVTHLIGIAKGDMNIGFKATSATGKYVSAEGHTCMYCREGKKSLEKINPTAYAECSTQGTKCCQAPCPSEAVINDDVPYIGQCSPADMGGGGNCWTDGIEPDNPNAPSGSRYCSSACGVASTRMALQTFGLDESSRDLFCGGSDSIYEPGGSFNTRISREARDLGLKKSYTKSGSDWDDVVSAIESGKIVVFSLNDYAGFNGEIKESGSYTSSAKNYAKKNNERCFITGGHYVVMHGGNNDYAIINDPYDPKGICGRNKPVNMVLSKEYVSRVMKSYSVIG